MTDDVENRLRRYRPAGPPPSLRERIVNDSRQTKRSRGIWQWLPAAAAAAAALFFYVAAFDLRVDVASRSLSDRERAAAVHDLAEQLGGDERARAEAERIVLLTELKAAEEATQQPSTALEVPAHD